VVAVDISGEPSEERREHSQSVGMPGVHRAGHGNAITTEKLKHGAPDIMVRPKVGLFRTLDFFQASAILRAAEPAKAEIRAALGALLGNDRQRTSQRRASSSVALFRLIQFTAAK